MWRAYAEAAHHLGARLTAEVLGPGRSGKRLEDLARRLQRELDPMMQKAFESLSEAGDIACAAGCDQCCRTLPVTAGPFEIFVLAHRIADMTAGDPGLAARIAAAAEATSAGSARSDGVEAPGAVAPCPLLGEDGLCRVYSSRPLACRSCVSGDVAACMACADTTLVPRSTAHQLGAGAMMQGVRDALDGLGLAGALVELRAGLAMAVADETAERRWLRGEDVFGDAERDAAGPDGG